MKYLNSPLCYTGNKYSLLPQILPLFPENINTFVDLFCGGGSVFINAKANKIIANDNIEFLIKLYKYWQNTPTEEVIDNIENEIKILGLSQTNPCAYYKLRDRYNQSKDLKDFYLLCVFCFNGQIRFNNKGEFNSSFGKTKMGWNKIKKNKLINFCNALHNKNIELLNKDFSEVDLSNLIKNDFVYIDPPYLISTAVYNDGARGISKWNEKYEVLLYELLDELNDRNIKFALSNVFAHKGQINKILIEWSKKYKVNYLDKQYKNCNYCLNIQEVNKNIEYPTIEVLITNY